MRWLRNSCASVSDIRIVLADTDALRNLVYRFRYDIYVKRMGRRQLYADPSSEAIVEPQDRLGRTHLALDGQGNAIGTIRSNLASDTSMIYYRKLYRLDEFEFSDLSDIQITTKFIIHPSHRGSTLAHRIIRDFAIDGYIRSIKINFIDCNKSLINFFERLGYSSYCGWRFHKEYGTVRPMFYAVDAVNHLHNIGSLLYKVAASRVVDNQYGGSDLVRRFATPGIDFLNGPKRAVSRRVAA